MNYTLTEAAECVGFFSFLFPPMKKEKKTQEITVLFKTVKTQGVVVWKIEIRHLVSVLFSFFSHLFVILSIFKRTSKDL